MCKLPPPLPAITNFSSINYMDAAALANAIMDMAWGMQEETANRDDDMQRKMWATLELIRHSAASLLDYLNALDYQNTLEKQNGQHKHA